MPLPIFDNEADIPEAFRPEYMKGEDGKWRSKADEEIEVEKRKRSVLLDEKKEEVRKRQDAERRAEEAERTVTALRSGVPEAELARIRAEEAKAREPLEQAAATAAADAEAARKELRKVKLTDRVKTLALKHGVLTDAIDDAMLVIEPRTDLGDADGIVFKNEKGEVTAQQAEAFFADLKIKRPWFFAFSGTGGSGSQGSHSSTTVTPPGKTNRPAQAASVAGAF